MMDKSIIEKAEQGHIYDQCQRTEYVGILMLFSSQCDIEALLSSMMDRSFAISRISAMEEWFTFAGSRMKRKFPGGTTWIVVLPVASPSSRLRYCQIRSIPVPIPT
jgi:hypothetical protein